MSKCVKRFSTKLQLMISQINHDIKFEDNANTKEKKKNMIQDFMNDDIDKSLLDELKNSISPTSLASSSVDSLQSHNNININIEENNVKVGIEDVKVKIEDVKVEDVKDVKDEDIFLKIEDINIDFQENVVKLEEKTEEKVDDDMSVLTHESVDLFGPEPTIKKKRAYKKKNKK